MRVLQGCELATTLMPPLVIAQKMLKIFVVSAKKCGSELRMFPHIKMPEIWPKFDYN